MGSDNFHPYLLKECFFKVAHTCIPLYSLQKVHFCKLRSKILKIFFGCPISQKELGHPLNSRSTDLNPVPCKTMEFIVHSQIPPWIHY